MLIRITSGYFCAGVVVDEKIGAVSMTAPIIGYMRGWAPERVLGYCRKRGWKAEKVNYLRLGDFETPHGCS